MTIRIDLNKTILTILCIICVIVPFIVYGTAIVKSVQMDADCVSYFRLAGDANSVKLAEKHLTTAITYLEEHDLINGYTKIIFYKPTNDFGIWYENLKSAQGQLQELASREDLTDLEESNALMKLRETLFNSGDGVTHPFMISFYPNCIAWFWTLCLIWLLWIGVVIVGCVAYVKY